MTYVAKIIMTFAAKYISVANVQTSSGIISLRQYDIILVCISTFMG